MKDTDTLKVDSLGYNLYDCNNVKIVTQPKYGKLVQKSNYEYDYTPDLNHKDDLDEFKYSATVSKNKDHSNKMGYPTNSDFKNAI